MKKEIDIDFTEIMRNFISSGIDKVSKEQLNSSIKLAGDIGEFINKKYTKGINTGVSILGIAMIMMSILEDF